MRVFLSAASVFFILFTFSAQAAAPPAASNPKITFFSSFPPLKGPFYLHWGFFKHYIPGLESRFLQHFRDSGYTLVVKRNPNRADLFDALHDPTNVGIFWVSHGAPQSVKLLHGAIRIFPRLMDTTGSDVKDLFQEVPPQIKWVSIVSCDSNRILKSEPIDPESDPKIHLIDHLTDARRGLKEALEQSDAVLSQNPPAIPPEGSCPKELGYPIRITRTYRVTDQLSPNTNFPAVTIQYRKKSLASFPQIPVEQVQQAGGVLTETQTAWLQVPNILGNPHELRLIAQSGLSPIAVEKNFQPRMGSFEVTAPWEGAKWTTYSDPATGEILGVTSNILSYQGPLVISSPPQEFSPATCE